MSQLSLSIMRPIMSILCFQGNTGKYENKIRGLRSYLIYIDKQCEKIHNAHVVTRV